MGILLVGQLIYKKHEILLLSDLLPSKISLFFVLFFTPERNISRNVAFFLLLRCVL